MNAVLETHSCVNEIPDTPVVAARAAVEAAQAELAGLDARLRGYEREEAELKAQRLEHNKATIVAVSRSQPLPKPLKLKASQAEVAVPILRDRRKELAEREAEAQGRLRKACVQDVERRYGEAQDAFAGAAASLIGAWQELIAIHALLDQAGVTRDRPLPAALLSDFSIPAVGAMKPLAENHPLHFLAAHMLDQGEGKRATWAARREIEGEIGMVLPW